MRKKINSLVQISICLIMVVLTSFLLGNVYADCKCDVNVSISETDLKKSDKFTVDVNISNIQSEMGIMAFGTTIDYDKTSLTIEKIEGLNNWETPVNGSSFNVENGKIAITKSGFAKENETIIRITFQVTEESKKDLNVTLKEISLSDGTGIVKVEEISKSITVKNGSNKKNSNKGKGTIITVIIVLAVLGLIIYKNKNTKKK